MCHCRFIIPLYKNFITQIEISLRRYQLCIYLGPSLMNKHNQIFYVKNICAEGNKRNKGIQGSIKISTEIKVVRKLE